jgi:diguanylate cyclase (GGDEF)-like protein
VAAGVAVAGCVVVLLFAPHGIAATTSDVAQAISAGAAGTTMTTRARHRPRGRRRAATLLVGLACFSWCVGQVYWTWATFHGQAVPFPSAADGGYLGFSLLACAGLVAQPSGDGATAPWQRLLDGVMTSGAVGLISWLTTLGAVVDADDESVVAHLLLLAYPLFDVLLVVLTLRLLGRRSDDRGTLRLISAGLVALGVGDSMFTYVQAKGIYDGGLTDLGWIVGFTLVALAGTCRAAEPAAGPVSAESDTPRASASFLPYVPVVVVGGVLAVEALHGHTLTPGEQLIGSLIVLSLLARQYLTLRDNARLTADLLVREDQLRHQAFHDPLTGLANRSLFRDRLDHALARQGRELDSITVVFIDLDDFKVVNDTHGHSAGDQLLVEIAERLLHSVRPGDTVARLGGDEFAVLIEDGGLPGERAATVEAAVHRPFGLDDGTLLEVRASIGVYSHGPDDAALLADEVLARSDAAMYSVKRAGKARADAR